MAYDFKKGDIIVLREGFKTPIEIRTYDTGLDKGEERFVVVYEALKEPVVVRGGNEREAFARLTQVLSSTYDSLRRKTSLTLREREMLSHLENILIQQGNPY